MHNKKIILCMFLSSLSAHAMQQGDSRVANLEKLKRLSTRQDLSKFTSQKKLIYSAKRAIQDGNRVALVAILAPRTLDFTPKEYEYTSASFALLIWAVKMRRLEMCELLLQAGANPNASSIEHVEGNNVLSQTIYEGIYPLRGHGVLEFCKLFIKYGVEVNQCCLHAADALGNKEIKKLMEQHTKNELKK